MDAEQVQNFEPEISQVKTKYVWQKFPKYKKTKYVQVYDTVTKLCKKNGNEMSSHLSWLIPLAPSTYSLQLKSNKLQFSILVCLLIVSSFFSRPINIEFKSVINKYF